eukprot:UN4567
MAVLREFAEPAAPVEGNFSPFLSCQVLGATKGVRKPLRPFQRVLEGGDFGMPVGFSPLPLRALREGGIYSVAKGPFGGRAPGGGRDSPRALLGGFGPRDPAPSLGPGAFRGFFLRVGAVAAAPVLFALLFWWGQGGRGGFKKCPRGGMDCRDCVAWAPRCPLEG